MALRQNEQLEEVDDDDLGLGFYAGVTFESSRLRHRRRPSYAKRAEQLRIESSSKLIYRTRRQMVTAQSREMSADVNRALAASGLVDIIIGGGLGVTTLTAVRAKAIFRQNYVPHYHTRNEAAKRFNDVIKERSKDFNQRRPKLEVTLGRISVYGLSHNPRHSTYPIGLFCPIKGEAGDAIISEYDETVAALSADSGMPIDQSSFFPHVTLAAFRNRAIAERFVDRLDAINDVASLTDRVIMLGRVQIKGVSID